MTSSLPNQNIFLEGCDKNIGLERLDYWIDVLHQYEVTINTKWLSTVRFHTDCLLSDAVPDKTCEAEETVFHSVFQYSVTEL